MIPSVSITSTPPPAVSLSTAQMLKNKEKQKKISDVESQKCCISSTLWLKPIRSLSDILPI